MAVIAVIPARYGSSRLPAKPLREIGGVPMVVRVWRSVCACSAIDRVVVATDHDQIAAVVRQAGGEVRMTSPDHPSGTDRVAEVARSLRAAIYLNVQGDLPFVAAADLTALVAPMRAEPRLAMATLATPLLNQAEWSNPNVVKVVCDSRGNALYFSRAGIPFPREGSLPVNARRHLGVYAYRRGFLLKFASLPPGVLERIEMLEQLRALENGFAIRVAPAAHPSLEIDTPEDLARAQEAARPSEGRNGA
ncbi:MAG TPA: 3-deoxy-manno-octulosonate cytidylyltransferase [Candidatus Binataceae bacterium]|nr:3-deoxy-manno-octulosonate cytidylyltransferase [Candidatus Binataceae bacterium]